MRDTPAVNNTASIRDSAHLAQFSEVKYSDNLEEQRNELGNVRR